MTTESTKYQYDLLLILTVKSKKIVTKRPRVINEKAAQSQSEPWVLMWMSAFGGLRSRAWLAIATESYSGGRGERRGCIGRGIEV